MKDGCLYGSFSVVASEESAAEAAKKNAAYDCGVRSPADMSSLPALDALANAAARLVVRQPGTAAAKLEEAHGMAVEIGATARAAALSSLIERCFRSRRMYARAFWYARRASREGSFHSLASLCHSLADRFASAKPVRAATLYGYAATSYQLVADDEVDVGQRRTTLSLRDRCQRLAARVPMTGRARVIVAPVIGCRDCGERRSDLASTDLTDSGFAFDVGDVKGGFVVRMIATVGCPRCGSRRVRVRVD